RIPAMVIGMIAATALGFAAPFAGGLPVLLVLRVVEGVALGAVPAVALAYLSEEVSVRHVAAASASYIGGTTVGGLAGRLLSGQVGEPVDWRAGMWATTAAARSEERRVGKEGRGRGTPER